MSSVITLPYQYIACQNKRPAFPHAGQQLRVRWEYQIPEPSQRSWLRMNDSGVWLVMATRGITRITRNKPPGIVSCDFPVYQLYPGLFSNPVVVSDNGDIYRWKNEVSFELVLRTNDEPSSLIPTGLPHDKIFIKRYKNTLLKKILRRQPWSASIMAGEATQWEIDRYVRVQFFLTGGIVLGYDNDNELLYINVSGTIKWSCRMQTLTEEIIGLAEHILWVRSTDGLLSGIDVNTGEVVFGLRVPHAKNPLCVMDEKGRLVVCNGLGVSIIDGVAGQLIYTKQIAILDNHSSSSAHGNTVLLTGNDLVIYADYYNNLFAVPLMDDKPGIFLWRSPDLIRGYAIVEDSLILLHGTHLTALTI